MGYYRYVGTGGDEAIHDGEFVFDLLFHVARTFRLHFLLIARQIVRILTAVGHGDDVRFVFRSFRQAIEKRFVEADDSRVSRYDDDVGARWRWRRRRREIPRGDELGGMAGNEARLRVEVRKGCRHRCAAV